MSRQPSSEEIAARRVRLAYQYERHVYERIIRGQTKPYRPDLCWRGSSTNTVWLRLVRFCAGQNIEPIIFLKWALDVQTLLLTRPPEPNQLLSAARVNNFQADRLNSLRLLENLFSGELQRASIQTSINLQRFKGDSQKAATYVICDTFLELSNLMRYCIAYHCIGQVREPQGGQFHRLAEKFEVAASSQYLADPDGYDAIWQERIPPGFRERAYLLYDERIGMPRPKTSSTRRR